MRKLITLLAVAVSYFVAYSSEPEVNLMSQNYSEMSKFNMSQSIAIENEDEFEFPTIASGKDKMSELRLRSNILPWLIAIPNAGLEYVISNKWSAMVDVWFCPWKISDKFSIKTVAILPEVRWWLKESRKGSFFNLHANVAWYNVRANVNRFQDVSRPLLGAGIGYGYLLNVNSRWNFEFEIGAGYANMKYDCYYNVPNGALKDVRVSNYFGIDRLSVAVTYFLCDI